MEPIDIMKILTKEKLRRAMRENPIRAGKDLLPLQPGDAGDEILCLGDKVDAGGEREAALIG